MVSSPIFAEIYMNEFEKSLIRSTSYKDKLKMWVRYVDDVLVIWEGSVEELKLFIKEVDSIDQNIQFKEKIEFDTFREEMYSDIIIPSESYHPYKMVAINAFMLFCYRASKCLKNKNKEKEERRIKNIVKNNNYKAKLLDIIMKNMNVKNDKENKEEKNYYIGSISFIGTSTKKIIKYFKKYGLDVTIKKCKTVFDSIKNNNVKNTYFI